MRTSITGMLSRLIAAAALALAALPGSAQSVFSDSMTVRDGTGAIVEQVIVTEADEIAAGPGFIFMLKTAVDPTQFSNYSTLYDDPSNVNSTGDIFGIADDGTGALKLAFASDIDGQDLSIIFGGAGPNAFLEVLGAAYDATLYLDPALQALGWTATFVSDGDVATPPPVAEPASLSLMGLAALGLWATRRRSIRST